MNWSTDLTTLLWMPDLLNPSSTSLSGMTKFLCPFSEFQNLAILIENERSNCDLVMKLRSQVNSQINAFIDTTFAGIMDPPLHDLLSALRSSNFINMFKPGYLPRYSQAEKKAVYDEIGRLLQKVFIEISASPFCAPCFFVC
jgi:hypothetical protein